MSDKYIRFGLNIRKRMEGTAIGYAYAIFQNKEVKDHGHYGWAVTPADQAPGFEQSSTRRMATMSMSKTITAAATVKALAMHQPVLTIDSHIAPYLPANWLRGPGVASLTFKHLLTHTSKLVDMKSDPDTYASLQATILLGSNGPVKYQNSNFTLLRILIPYILLGPAHFQPFEGDPDRNAAITASHYIAFVQDHVLDPAGITGASIGPTGPKPFTRYYNFNLPVVSDADPDDNDDAKLRCGAGYWNLSAQEYGRFIAALPAGDIMHPERWLMMSSNLLGCYAFGSDGKRRGHNGGFQYSDFAGCSAGWLTCPDGVTAVLLINSLGGDHADPPKLLSDAYDAALN